MPEAAPGQKLNLRQRIHLQLEPAAWTGPGLSPLNRVIALTICIASAAVILESEPGIHDAYAQYFNIAEIAFTTIFAIEYLMRLWVAGEDPRYRGVLGRIRFIFTPGAIIDLLALSPAFLVFLGSEAYLLRLFRLLRILRLAKLGRYSMAFTAILEALRARRYELIMSVAIAGMLLLVSSTLLYIVEGGNQQEAFGSIPRAMWWSIATLTTVGYGDVFPVTTVGRILAGFTALTGIGLIAMPTGILASAFSDAIQRQRRADADAASQDAGKTSA